MAIFNSYVCLPEGTSNIVPNNATMQHLPLEVWSFPTWTCTIEYFHEPAQVQISYIGCIIHCIATIYIYINDNYIYRILYYMYIIYILYIYIFKKYSISQFWLHIQWILRRSDPGMDQATRRSRRGLEPKWRPHILGHKTRETSCPQ